MKVNSHKSSKFFLVTNLAILALNSAMVLSPKAIAQVSGSVPSYVKVQTSTPGTVQTGHANLSGNVKAGQFQGNGTQLTGLDATNVTTGTLADARLSANLPRLDGANNWTGTNNLMNSQNQYSGNGQLLTNLNAGSLASGSIPDARIAVGGDIKGPIGASTVQGIQGVAVTTVAPQNNQVLGFDGAQWAARADSLSLPYSKTAVNTGSLFSVVNQSNLGGTAVSGICNFGGTGVLGLSGSIGSVPDGCGVVGSSTEPGGYGVYGSSGSGSFAAGRFNRGTLYAELAGAKALATNGFVWREYVSNVQSVAVPIAYGVVSSSGAVLGGTGNFVVSHPAVGQFDVVVDGETYSNNTFVVTVTPVSNSDRHACVADAGSGFRVNMFNQAGTLSDTQFQFTVWTRDPAASG